MTETTNVVTTVMLASEEGADNVCAPLLKVERRPPA